MIEEAAIPDAAAQIAGLIFAVLLIDEDGRIRNANPAAEEMFGLAASRMLGRAYREIVSICDRHVGAALDDSEQPLIARGVLITTALGKEPMNLSSSPVIAHPGWRVLTLSRTGTEGTPSVTPQPNEVGAPTVLAHEIKNPLAAIGGAGQLLGRRVEEKDRHLTDLITREVERIAGLIDRMQQLGSTASIDLGPCNLHASIRNAMASVRAARPGGCELIEEFDPSLPLVHADVRSLEQILINLLTNACEASEDAETNHVVVRTRFVSGIVHSTIQSGKPVRLPIEICVLDHGPGIPEELRDDVFEPFVTGKSHGQGLGLALVRKLVRDLGGRITHERNERAGQTLFRVNLALAEKDARG